MPNITLPDGKKLAFKEKVSGLKVAEKISKSLAKEALVISVDGKLKDLSYEIEKDCKVKVLTSKDKDGLILSDMTQRIFWQWQFKNYFLELK